MTDRTFHLETIGCQMNVLDSELLAEQLAAAGWRRVSDPASATLVALNTCSVRQHAEDKVWSRLGTLAAARRRAARPIVAVVGCMAEHESAALLDRGGVDILCGPNDLHQFAAMVEAFETEASPSIALSGAARDRSTVASVGDLEQLDAGRHGAVAADRRAYVRITRGCNKHCSFCVVPSVRGPERHRRPEAILDEVRRLADAGVVEVTLLGQTVNHYRGHDANGEVSFAQLLRQIHDEVPQIARLRFVTSYPRDFGDDILDAMADCPRICRYLHLPAQSGSNAVLARMNRGYTAERYLDLLDRARRRLPDVTIAGDMIVGFPGETDADHAASMALLWRARYKSCFIFRYSPRPGTVAARRFADDVLLDAKRRRHAEMLAEQHRLSLAANRCLIGRTVEILVEGPSKSQQKAAEVQKGLSTIDAEHPSGHDNTSDSAPYSTVQLTGRTRGDRIVVVDGPATLAGHLRHVRITDATSLTLHADLVAGST